MGLPALTLCSTLATAARAEVEPDPLVGSELPAASNPHWVWVNDFVFQHMGDGKAFLVDGDAGRMLGMLSTGFGFGGVVLPRNRSQILSPETYFSRGTRGTRTDVVTFYDPRKLSPTGEVQIEPKRASAMPMLAQSGLTDDDRFLFIYNFTPAQSITVVDVQNEVVRRRDRRRRVRARLSDRTAQLFLAVRRRQCAHRAAQRRGRRRQSVAHGTAVRSGQGSGHRKGRAGR